MKFSVAATVIIAMAGLAACDGPKVAAEKPASTPDLTAPPAETAPAPMTATPASAASVPVAVAPGAPAFAAVYPGGEIEGDPTLAAGPAGPGGLITFKTDAAPEQVVAFYRQRAEAEGMAPVMEMNQGAARAYGAAKEASGANVQVVASPTENDETSVQLSWSAGE